MKAAYFNEHGGIDKIILGEVPKPIPKSGEVLVQVKYSAVNHLDIWVRKGWPGLKNVNPHILGGDASGVIDKLGSKSQTFKEGDEVIVHPGLSCGSCQHCTEGWESLCADYAILGEQVSGTHAEWVSVPERNLFLKPKNLSFAEAAGLPLVFTTAWQMLVTRAKARKGDKVLIHGAGSGVSVIAVQIAKILGLEVAVTSTHHEKLKKAKTLGATIILNSEEVDFSKEIRKFWSKGPDIILDHIGQAFWEKNIKCLRSGGILVTCGATSGGAGVTDLKHLFFRQLSLLGSTMGNKKDFNRGVELCEKGELRSIIDKEFTLSQVAQAHSYLENKSQFGKVVIKV